MGSIWLCAPTGIHGARRLLPAPRAERPTPRSARWPHLCQARYCREVSGSDMLLIGFAVRETVPSLPGSPGREENPSLTCKTSKEPPPAWRCDQAQGEMKSFPGRAAAGEAGQLGCGTLLPTWAEASACPCCRHQRAMVSPSCSAARHRLPAALGSLWGSIPSCMCKTTAPHPLDGCARRELASTQSSLDLVNF